MAKEHEEKKMITANEVADYFIALSNGSGEAMTNLKLQKLVYYAQAWHLANEDTPLFNEDFQAWVHGPVIPDLYHEYKEFGASPIVKEIDIEGLKARLGDDVVSYLDEVAGVYMPYGGYHLEMMTHKEDPWIEARGGCQDDEICAEIISKEKMRTYYGQKLKV